MLTEINGVRLAYDAHGSGAPVVLLHGASGRRRSFDRLIPLLGSQVRAYAVDLRGHGESGHVPGQYRVDTFASDVRGFLREVVARPAVIVGHSLGALVGGRVASDEPDLVSGLVIGDVPLAPGALRELMAPNAAWAPMWKALLEPGTDRETVLASLRGMEVGVPGCSTRVPLPHVFGADHPWFDQAADQLAGQDPDLFDAFGSRFEETFAPWNPWEILGKIAAPTLLLQGDSASGGLLSDEDVRMALDLLPVADHVFLDGVGHGLQEHWPERVAEPVREFIRACADVPPAVR